jgi:hypothetical protein
MSVTDDTQTADSIERTEHTCGETDACDHDLFRRTYDFDPWALARDHGLPARYAITRCTAVTTSGERCSNGVCDETRPVYGEDDDEEEPDAPPVCTNHLRRIESDETTVETINISTERGDACDPAGPTEELFCPIHGLGVAVADEE